MSHLVSVVSPTNMVIEVRDVYKSFKTVHAVQGINLNLKKGQFLALLGPNGAGKTTLVEMIEGIQKPDRGEILIMGRPWKGHEDELHQMIGLSLQETYFLEKLRVSETLALFASFYKLDGSRVEEIIDMVGLQEKRKALVGNLSGGQKQRLALGVSLLNKPKIILLDEPTTGLDPNARREIWTILNRLKADAETSIVLTTHYMEEAEQLCDYIIIVDHGKILSEGTLDDLLSASQTGEKIEFTLENPEISPNRLMFPPEFEMNWNSISSKGSAKVNDVTKQLPLLFDLFEKHNLKVRNFECKKQTLDDLFTQLTGRHLNE